MSEPWDLQSETGLRASKRRLVQRTQKLTCLLSADGFFLLIPTRLGRRIPGGGQGESRIGRGGGDLGVGELHQLRAAAADRHADIAQGASEESKTRRTVVVGAANVFQLVVRGLLKLLHFMLVAGAKRQKTFYYDIVVAFWTGPT